MSTVSVLAYVVDVEVIGPENGSESDCSVDVFFQSEFLKGRHRYDLSSEESRKSLFDLVNCLRIGRWDPLRLERDFVRSGCRRMLVTFPPLGGANITPYVSGRLRYKEECMMGEDVMAWFDESDQQSQWDVLLYDSNGEKVIWSIFPLEKPEKGLPRLSYSGKYSVDTKNDSDVWEKYGDKCMWSIRNDRSEKLVALGVEREGDLTTLVFTPPRYEEDHVLKGRYVALPGLTNWKECEEEIYNELIQEG